VLSASATAVAVVGELELDRRFAWGDPLAAVDRVLLKAYKVVRVGRLAVLGVEAPNTEPAALAQHHATGATGRNLYVGRDRHRLVLHVDERILHHAGHALIDRERL